MDVATYGLDIAKNIFQVYWVEPETGVIHNRKFSKQALWEFMACQKSGLVALESCGSANGWWRKLISLGHEVKLIHAGITSDASATN